MSLSVTSTSYSLREWLSHWRAGPASVLCPSTAVHPSWSKVNIKGKTNHRKSKKQLSGCSSFPSAHRFRSASKDIAFSSLPPNDTDTALQPHLQHELGHGAAQQRSRHPPRLTSALWEGLPGLPRHTAFSEKQGEDTHGIYFMYLNT